MIIFLL